MLLSFVAQQPIQVGDAVAVSTTVSGQIIPANPSGLVSASVVGVAIDTVSAGGLCRVVSDSAASVYSSLSPGSNYYLSPSGGYVVNYATYVTEFYQLGVSSLYLTQLGIAVNQSSIRVNPSEPKLVVSGYL